MAGPLRVSYFLGANTARGFYSLYEDFAKEEADMVWYIKGSPGNGKSSFMRTVAEAAEQAGHTVEYALCSGDPQSLDGIYIKELRTAYVDATAPHVQEPPLPGADGKYLDLSAFYKAGKRPDRSAVSRFFQAYRQEYVRAYDLLRAAELTDPRGIPGLITEEDARKAAEKGKAMGSELLPDGNGYETKKRFCSAYTCLGYWVNASFLQSYDRVFLIEDAFGLADPWLRGLAQAAREKELNTIFCPDSLDPHRLEGVFIPQADVSFFKAGRGRKLSGEKTARIRLDELLARQRALDMNDEIKKARSLRDALIRNSIARLKKAKQIHDELELYYHPFVDFKALDRFTQKHIRENIRT